MISPWRRARRGRASPTCARRSILVAAEGIGAARLGMTLQQAAEVLADFGPVRRYPHDSSRWATTGDVHIAVELDRDGRVESLELSDPWACGAQDTRYAVTFDGIALFDDPADDVVAQLQRRVAGHLTEAGHSFTAPDVLLALYRDSTGRNEQYDDEPPRHWSAVLVAAPGYYKSTGTSG